MNPRIPSGILAAVLLVALIFTNNLYLITPVILSLAAMSYLEYDKILFKTQHRGRQLRVVLFITLGILALDKGLDLGLIAIWAFFISAALIHIAFWNRSGDFQSGMQAIGYEMFGYLYILSLFGFLIPIIIRPFGPYYLLYLFLIVFGGDSAAYFVGLKLGRHTLASQLSPKKTLEGAAGALAASFLITGLWLFWILPEKPPAPVIRAFFLFAPIGSVLAQAGDLLESLIKRSQKVKDSGNFLPGHGGVLDRIDGLALIAPIYYLFLTYCIESFK